LGDNPKDRRFIATITGRGYQFVAPVTEALNGNGSLTAPIATVVPATTSHAAPVPPLPYRRLGLTLVAVALAALGGTWYALHRPSKPPGEFSERRLTFNSSASPIESEAISPDGKYLAYSDSSGIHLRLLSTGEERPITSPGLASPGASVSVDSWFPNGT